MTEYREFMKFPQAAVADPKLIFGCALKAAASGIILAHYAHNHPSGALQPSHAAKRRWLSYYEYDSSINVSRS